ncbi:hypothetical protein ACJVDH_08265 [Pedobacter sp. AW1-32]|uniref:hypothetical protein n=1 Tax=Pedobacter sp. AW1-32 TaxID=3383026 RepID=UPI003FEFA4B3
MRLINTISLCLFLWLLAIDCRAEAKQTLEILNDAGARQIAVRQPRNRSLKQLKSRSFVVSCGGGCAMTYTAIDIKQYVYYFKVQFKVDMYINEVLTDTYKEIYLFYTNGLKTDKVLDLNNNDVLKTLPLGARKSFIEFGTSLVSAYGTEPKTKK